MPKTPPLRVSRPVSACSRCRSAKIRCDGKLPACTACERAGKAPECSSGNDQFARGKERSYVASLETRIERLERQLHYQHHVAQPSVFPIAESKASRKVEASHVEELVSDFGHLAVNATSNGYHGFDREMSLARLLLSTATVKELPRASDHPLPPRSVAVGLLHACVASFFTLCPLMSFTAALGALERVYHHSSRMASAQDVWNVRLCLAMGLSARSKAKGDSQYESAIRHVSVAVDTVGEAVVAPGSLTRLRGLVLLVLYSTVNPAYLDSWYLMGMASRFTAEMGLHAAAAEDVKAARADERRILFSLVYGLDRHISMSRLMPFSFSDDSADLSIPPSVTPRDILANAVLNPTVVGANEDYARTFTQIQQEQSAWYQALYYTDRAAAQQPYTTRLAAFRNNHAWASKIPLSVKGPLRSRFLAHVSFGSVLLMLPLESSVATTSLYGKALALESVCNYADAIDGTTGKVETVETTNHDDFLRTMIVGRRLLQLVMDTTGPVYVPPAATLGERSISVPDLSWTLQGGTIPRVIETLRKLDGTLALLNIKYGFNGEFVGWERNSDTALQMLCGHNN